ncbi:MAG: caspase family protein [Rubrivivax sp.]
MRRRAPTTGTARDDGFVRRRAREDPNMHARRLCQAMTLVVVALLLLAGAVAPSPARAAFGLEVGQEVRNAIDVRALRKIPLPPGRWKVDASFEEKQGLNQVGRLEMPIHNLVLSNGDRQADIPVLVLRFTDLARASWTGQPCDTPHASPALSSNTFGSTASSLNIRCNRVFAFDHFRRSVGQGNMSPNAWLSKRFATLSSRSAELPVHTLVGHAYMSAHRGDWLEAWAYANPAPHGLEAAPDGGPFFRSPDRLGDRAEVARRYTRTFAEWFDGYTTAVYQQYLEGNAAEVPKFVFGNARPSTVAAAAPGNAAPPTAAPRPPPAAPQAASQAPAAAPPVARPAATAPASVHALVIGNAAYKGAPLLNSGNDARAMAQRLRTYGFEVTLLLDATRKQMVDALSRFAEKASRSDLTIVFYAGHGLQLHGVNYLIPVDLDLANTKALGLTYEAVSLNALLEDHLPGRARGCSSNACPRQPAGANGQQPHARQRRRPGTDERSRRDAHLLRHARRQHRQRRLRPEQPLRRHCWHTWTRPRTSPSCCAACASR